MEKAQKERVVAELTEQLQQASTLLVADYRGLSMTEIDSLRTEVLEARRDVPRRQEHADPACRRSGRPDALLALLEGPTGDRVPRVRRRPGRGRQGALRRRPDDEDPRHPRRRCWRAGR